MPYRLQLSAESSTGSEGSLSWRDEIDIVLQEWISRARRGPGRATLAAGRYARGRPESAGVYVVDIRASDLTADQADNLRLAGPDDRGVQAGFPVMEATIDGELIRLRVAEFAAPAEPYLWRLRQEPTFLVTALREGLSSLNDAGLASLLARGEVGGVPGDGHPAARAAARAGGRLPGLPGHGTVAGVGPAGHGENPGAPVRCRRSDGSGEADAACFRDQHRCGQRAARRRQGAPSPARRHRPGGAAPASRDRR